SPFVSCSYFLLIVVTSAWSNLFVCSLPSVLPGRQLQIQFRKRVATQRARTSSHRREDLLDHHHHSMERQPGRQLPRRRKNTELPSRIRVRAFRLLKTRNLARAVIRSGGPPMRPDNLQLSSEIARQSWRR